MGILSDIAGVVIIGVILFFVGYRWEASKKVFMTAVFSMLVGLILTWGITLWVRLRNNNSVYVFLIITVIVFTLRVLSEMNKRRRFPKIPS